MVWRANSRLQATSSAARVAGPGLGGLLVSALGAPFALIADVLSFVVAAVTIGAIRQPEEPGSLASRKQNYQSSIAESLRFVYRDPILRLVTIGAATVNLAMMAIGTIEIPYLARDLRVSASGIGLIMGIGSLGGIVGAILTGRLAARWGSGRTTWVALSAIGPASLLLPLAPPGTGLALFAVGLFILQTGTSVSSILTLTFRQTYCPPDMIARVSACVRALQMGTMPLGAFLGGLAGGMAGNRPALWIFGIVSLLPAVLCVILPTARLRDFPDQPSRQPASPSLTASA